MSAETRPNTSTTEALALLALPPFNSLSEQQVRGITCIWDGIGLSTATAVDLGPREVTRLGQKRQWYPRACHRCAHEAAYAALMRHAPACTDGCVNDIDACETGRALRRLMREYRR